MGGGEGGLTSSSTFSAFVAPGNKATDLERRFVRRHEDRKIN